MAAALLECWDLRLHTALDERSAAFFALGIGRALGRPAAVITTSGTAVANLLPAAVEADHSSIPLLLISADRPARLKGCGANQSVNQEDFLRSSCRWVGQADPDGLEGMASADLDRLAAEAMLRTTGQGGESATAAGPVHLNLAFDEPLHADAPRLAALARELAEAWPGEPAGQAETGSDVGIGPCPQPAPPLLLDPDRPGVVVAGPWWGDPSAWNGHVEALRRWQRRTGWPVLADALSGLRGLGNLELIGAYDLVLECPPPHLDAPQVLRLGPLPASRRLQRWLERLEAVQVLVSERTHRPLDPLRRIRGQWNGGLADWVAAGLGASDRPALPGPAPLGPARLGPAPEESRALARRWQRAEQRVQALLDQELAEPAALGRGWSEPGLARWLSRQLPADRPLMLANSSPVRDWELFAAPTAPWRIVHSFRGASGIDGTLSIGAGLATAHGSLVLVTGDLALLHDSNGWLWRSQLRGRLTVVLIDNGGGGIFEQLPIRTEPEAAKDFERLFAMPQGIDACALAAVHGVPGRRVRQGGELAAALAWALQQPMALVAIGTDRRGDAALRQRLRTMAAEELAQP